MATTTGTMLIISTHGSVFFASACVCVRVCVCVCCKPPTKASTLAEAMEEKEKSERKKRPERKKSSATAATCRFITRLASLNF